MSPPPFITFLTDYGLQDDFVGICHGVIATICPQARVIDLTHGVRRHDVSGGAVILGEALAYMPRGVHLAVVDPDVGAQRRAVALRLADDRLLVGPDNGVLMVAARVGGGVVEAVEISHSRFRLEPVSSTFHGRDIFAPVAARLAGGMAPAEVGDPCDPTELVVLELTKPRHESGALVAHVRSVDRFGNLQLDAGHEDLAGTGLKLGRTAELEPGPDRAREESAGILPRDGRRPWPESDSSRGRSLIFPALYVTTFSDVGRDGVLLYEDAHRRLSVAVSQGDAAARLGLEVGDELWIRPA